MFGRSKPRTIEGGVVHRELLDDVVADRRGGRGGQGEDGGVAELVDRLPEAQVVGAEVVAPLADAVCLVDDEQADAGLARARR